MKTHNRVPLMPAVPGDVVPFAYQALEGKGYVGAKWRVATLDKNGVFVASAMIVVGSDWTHLVAERAKAKQFTIIYPKVSKGEHSHASRVAWLPAVAKVLLGIARV